MAGSELKRLTSREVESFGQYVSILKGQDKGAYDRAFLDEKVAEAITALMRDIQAANEEIEALHIRNLNRQS